MIRARVTATCQNGHTHRVEALVMSLAYAEEWAGLMDGTSHLYRIPPAPDSQGMIGRCGICGAPFECHAKEIPLEREEVKPHETQGG